MAAMGFPVSPIVSNLYMEQFEHLALSTYLCTGLQSWHRYVDDTFVVRHSDENEKKIVTLTQLTRISSLPM